MLAAEGDQLLAGLTPVAPPLMWSESTSALREAVFRGSLAAEEADTVLQRLATARIEVKRPEALYREAYRIAGDLGWAKCYDAEYLALAKMLDCRLLTRDGRLKRGAGHIVEIVGPSDL